MNKKKITPEQEAYVKAEKVLKICENFIREMDIGCSEKIYQCDHVIENAYQFIKDICDVVGYIED